MVGVELEDELPQQASNDGVINGVRLFTCPTGRALFVQPEQCTVDRRFQDVVKPASVAAHSDFSYEPEAADNFGHIECPIIEGSVPPLSE